MRKTAKDFALIGKRKGTATHKAIPNFPGLTVCHSMGKGLAMVHRWEDVTCKKCLKQK